MEDERGRIWIVEDDPKIGLLIEMAVKSGHDAHRIDAVKWKIPEEKTAARSDAPI